MNYLNKQKSSLKPYEVMSLIQEKDYKAKDLGVSSRTIFNWKEKKLLFDIHDDKEKNTMLKFNLAEYFWIKVIQQCREYGMSLEEIKVIKTQIIDIVRSYDIEIKLEEKYKLMIKDVRDSHKGKSKKFIQEQVGNILKYLGVVEQEVENKRSHFQEVLNAVILNRKPSGLLIFKNGKEIGIDIYIESNKIDCKSKFLFYRSHLYISFDKIFVELGLSDHFKQKQLLTDEEVNSINIITQAIKSKRTDAVLIEKKVDKLKSIKIKLKLPKNNKEVEEYKMKLGKNLDYKTQMFNGKMNLFDFYFTINFMN
jgi:DNA-binding transcriptional MerR regulator